MGNKAAMKQFLGTSNQNEVAQNYNASQSPLVISTPKRVTPAEAHRQKIEERKKTAAAKAAAGLVEKRKIRQLKYGAVEYQKSPQIAYVNDSGRLVPDQNLFSYDLEKGLLTKDLEPFDIFVQSTIPDYEQPVEEDKPLEGIVYASAGTEREDPIDTLYEHNITTGTGYVVRIQTKQSKHEWRTGVSQIEYASAGIEREPITEELEQQPNREEMLDRIETSIAQEMINDTLDDVVFGSELDRSKIGRGLTVYIIVDNDPSNEKIHPKIKMANPHRARPNYDGKNPHILESVIRHARGRDRNREYRRRDTSLDEVLDQLATYTPK